MFLASKSIFRRQNTLPLPSWKVSTTSSTWQPSAPGAQPPSPPPLAPEAYDFRVVARDAQGKLKLVTSAGAFEDFEQAAAFAVTLMDCWQADSTTVDVCVVVDGEFCPVKVVDAS